MNPLDALDYGVAVFSIVAIIYIVYLYVVKNSQDNAHKQSNDELMKEYRQLIERSNAVIQNNTKALECLTALIRDLQISVVRQEEKLNELLERARK